MGSCIWFSASEYFIKSGLSSTCHRPSNFVSVQLQIELSTRGNLDCFEKVSESLMWLLASPPVESIWRPVFEINPGQTDDPVLASLPVLIDQRRSGNLKFSCRRRRSLLQYLGQVDKVWICRIRWRESINAHSMKNLKTGCKMFRYLRESITAWTLVPGKIGAYIHVMMHLTLIEEENWTCLANHNFLPSSYFSIVGQNWVFPRTKTLLGPRSVGLCPSRCWRLFCGLPPCKISHTCHHTL